MVGAVEDRSVELVPVEPDLTQRGVGHGDATDRRVDVVGSVENELVAVVERDQRGPRAEALDRLDGTERDLLATAVEVTAENVGGLDLVDVPRHEARELHATARGQGAVQPSLLRSVRRGHRQEVDDVEVAPGELVAVSVRLIDDQRAHRITVGVRLPANHLAGDPDRAAYELAFFHNDGPGPRRAVDEQHA